MFIFRSNTYVFIRRVTSERTISGLQNTKCRFMIGPRILRYRRWKNCLSKDSGRAPDSAEVKRRIIGRELVIKPFCNRTEFLTILIKIRLFQSFTFFNYFK